MSTSIRPPAGSPLGTTGVDGASEIKATEGLEQAAPLASSAPSSAASATALRTPAGAWLARLEAGEVTRSQAIEGLVAHALETHGGARLPPVQRAELEGILRAALLDDPLLRRLLGDS